MDATLRLLEGRINKYGLAEVNLTSLGENRFEISVPAEVDADGIQKVVEKMKGVNRKSRVTFYYLLAEATGTMGKLA